MGDHPTVQALIMLGGMAMGDDPIGGDVDGEPGSEAAPGVRLTGEPSPPLPTDPAQSPGAGWEWRGKGAVGSSEGSWYKPSTGESLHPDLQHGGSIGPHWDYTNSIGQQFRIFPDGTSVPK